MTAQMKGLTLHAVNDLQLNTWPIPVPKEDEILVKIGACGICGSDLPRVYSLGAHVYPLILGHEFAGEVVQVGNPKDADLIGKKAAVFPLIPCRECDPCLSGNYCQCENYGYLGSRDNGGFAQYCLVPSRWHLIVTHNDDVDLEALCMTEPSCVAQHAIRMGHVSAGSNVVILGAGTIGLLAARWAKLFGAEQVVLTEVDPVKEQFAKEKGFIVVNSMNGDGSKTIHEIFGGKGADVVIEGTGCSGGINDAIQLAKVHGTVVLMGNPAKDTLLKLANHSLVLRKELTLQGIWNSNYSNTPINEWEYTVKMIETGQLETADLITHRVGIDDMKSLFDQIHNREVTICKAIYSASLDQTAV